MHLVEKNESPERSHHNYLGYSIAATSNDPAHQIPEFEEAATTIIN